MNTEIGIILGYAFSFFVTFLCIALIFFVRIRRKMLIVLFPAYTFGLIVLWATLLAHEVILNGILPLILNVVLIVLFWYLRFVSLSYGNERKRLIIYLFAETGRSIMLLSLLTLVLLLLF